MTIIRPKRKGKAKPKILGFNLIKLDTIKKSDNPIRSKYKNIGMLAESLSYYGLIHPILVRPIAHPKYNYEVVAGHRRLMALRKKGVTEEWCSILPEDLSDWHALFYTGIENIHQEYVDRIDKGKWALNLLEMINPETGKKTTIKDIADRTGTHPRTLQTWIEAARTAINLEMASEEAKEQAKSFFYKIVSGTKEISRQFIFPKGEELGPKKLKLIRLVTKSPEETAKIATIIKYKDLTRDETSQFIKILREHPEEAKSDEFILRTATEVKGVFLTIQLPHKVRDALSDYAKANNTTMEKKLIQILKKTLREAGYLK